MQTNVQHSFDITQQLQAFFARSHQGVTCAYLYGSTARGGSHPASDIDIAVLYAQDPPATLDGLGFELAEKLERYLGKPVDLLVLNRASVDLIHRVLRDGVLVFDGAPAARIRFEVKARNEYFDLLPYLRQYRRTAWHPTS